jgi:hypothetical protein
MDKKELVGRLLIEGKISNEEAITLLSTQEPEQKITMIVDPIEVKLDKLLDDQFTEDLFSDDHSSVAKLNDIISFMHNTNWKWLGEEVTHSRFKEEVIFQIKQALMQLIEDYRVHNIPRHELHTFCECGGIRVDCTVNDGDEVDYDEDIVNIEVRFIAGNWISDINLNDII